MEPISEQLIKDFLLAQGRSERFGAPSLEELETDYENAVFRAFSQSPKRLEETGLKSRFSAVIRQNHLETSVSLLAPLFSLGVKNDSTIVAYYKPLHASIICLTLGTISRSLFLEHLDLRKVKQTIEDASKDYRDEGYIDLSNWDFQEGQRGNVMKSTLIPILKRDVTTLCLHYFCTF